MKLSEDMQREFDICFRSGERILVEVDDTLPEDTVELRDRDQIAVGRLVSVGLPREPADD